MGELLNKAIVYASEKHSSQVRKLNGQPYILHPMEVATIVASLTSDENVMCAGLLHDVVEDCKVDPKEIKELFGERVYELVTSETEDKKEGRSKEDTWKERKEESLAELKNTKDLDVKILWLSDKLSNVRSLLRSYLVLGDEVWKSFNQKDKLMHKWYHQSILENMEELKETHAYREYSLIIGLIFNGRSKEEDED